MTMFAFSRPAQLRICGWIAACAMTGTAFGAQTAVSRIRSEVSSSYVSTLKGSLHPLAQPRFDVGRVPSDTRLNGMTLVFNRSAAQEADLQTLLAAQQDPASSLFHKWLNPEQYAARFGMTQGDIDSVSLWLQQQGFSVDSVARSKNMIHFSGNVNQVEMAFQTQMHYYNVEGAKHFAPATELSLPAAIAPTVAAVMNLSDFRPKPEYIPLNKRGRGAFTSSLSGNVFFAPGDIKTVYDMTPLVTGGNDGTGQSIVVVGQSYVDVNDIAHFQTAASLPNKAPTLVLVPGSGTGTTTVAGDEGESDLDLEWSSAMAPGASVYFVYTGSNVQSYNVFNSIQYAVDQNLGNIITVSYGACESGISQANATALENTMSQGAAQGQTIISASGDEGSTACFIENPPQTGEPSLATQQSVSVSYPASSQYVTGVGGTEISAANDLDTNSTYWDVKGASDILTSAKIYIPEIAWNDEAYLISAGGAGLSASGGGVSALFAKPSWQAGVPGIPNDGKRDVPDVALYSSPSFPGYLYCTSDQSDWSPASGSTAAQAASCNSGFRDSSTTDLTIAGGTSFAAPIFAGMVAIINQKAGYTTGQGSINSKLYTLASNAGTYAAVFHDVTSGNNECLAGTTTYCSASSGSTTKYTTNVGYDLVTGLGSFDLNALAGAWTGSTTTLIGTKTTVAASSTTPALNANDTFTITVVSTTGSTIPSGTVAVSVDGGTATNETLTAAGTFDYTTSFTTSGGHTIAAQYQGDTTHAPSTGAITVTVPAAVSPGTFALGATDVTVSQGSSGTSTITVTPSGGYTGTVYLTFTSSNNTALSNLCYGFTNTLSNGDGSVAVTGTAAVTTQLTLDTKASDCVAAAVILGSKPGMHRLAAASGKTAKNSKPSSPNSAPLGVAFAGLLLVGFLGRKSRKLSTMVGIIVMLSIGLAVSACGGGGSSSGGGGGGGTPPTNPAKGTYTITLTGTDSVTATNTATKSFTLTIQ